LRALRLAIDQVKAVPGASLVVVTVQNIEAIGLCGGGGIMPAAWIEQQEEKAADETLELARAMCSEAGIACQTHCERGAVAAAIDRAAREEGATGIIMGTRGLSGVRWLLIGSVVTELLHLTEVPVTLVK
jgi:nucleotide-binding universal stress UspA family protein